MLEDPENPENASRSDRADPFEGLVLDEHFVRGAQEKEPSARARMLASKWKQHPPTDTGFRSDPTPQRRPGRRRRWAVVAAVVAVVLLLATVSPTGVEQWLHI